MLDIIIVRIAWKEWHRDDGVQGTGSSRLQSKEKESGGKWETWLSTIEPLCGDQSSITF